MKELKVNDTPLCLAHLPQEGNQVLGPGRAVLDTDCTEELHQGLHRVTGMDVIGPLVWKQDDKRRENRQMRKRRGSMEASLVLQLNNIKIQFPIVPYPSTQHFKDGHP